MSRTYVVTGVASGIGRAAAQLLRARGHRVIGADLRAADISADLSLPEGRAALIAQVQRMSDGALDGLVLAAGSSARTPATLAVNYFGAVELLAGLRPLLARSRAPRAVVVASEAALMPTDGPMIDACLQHDEARARSLAEGRGVEIYTSSKAALIRWCRRQSISRDWAGAGIVLNVVAPGIVDTPMMHDTLRDPERLKALSAQLPIPLGRVGQPEEVAELLCFLASAENSLMIGQVCYIDAGSEASNRGETVW